MANQYPSPTSSNEFYSNVSINNYMRNSSSAMPTFVYASEVEEEYEESLWDM